MGGDMEKIYTSVISRHDAHWGMFTAFQGAASYAIQKGYVPVLAPHVGDSLVSRARNNCLAKFLQTDCEWFFTLDDDIAIPPDTFVKLIEADKNMIGGFYRLKKSPPSDKEWQLGEMLAFRGENDFDLGTDKPVKVKYISTGCVMHKRSFIEEMVAHYPELLYQDNDGGTRWALYQPYVFDNGDFLEYLSEDWAFCQRALDKGYKLYMHTGVLCEHWGLYKYAIPELMNAK